MSLVVLRSWSDGPPKVKGIAPSDTDEFVYVPDHRGQFVQERNGQKPTKKSLEGISETNEDEKAKDNNEEEDKREEDMMGLGSPERRKRMESGGGSSNYDNNNDFEDNSSEASSSLACSSPQHDHPLLTNDGQGRYASTPNITIVDVPVMKPTKSGVNNNNNNNNTNRWAPIKPTVKAKPGSPSSSADRILLRCSSTSPDHELDSTPPASPSLSGRYRHLGPELAACIPKRQLKFGTNWLRDDPSNIGIKWSHRRSLSNSTPSLSHSTQDLYSSEEDKMSSYSSQSSSKTPSPQPPPASSHYSRLRHFQPTTTKYHSNNNNNGNNVNKGQEEGTIVPRMAEATPAFESPPHHPLISSGGANTLNEETESCSSSEGSSLYTSAFNNLKSAQITPHRAHRRPRQRQLVSSPVTPPPPPPDQHDYYRNLRRSGNDVLPPLPPDYEGVPIKPSDDAGMSVEPPEYDQAKLPDYQGMSVKPPHDQTKLPDYEGVSAKPPHYEGMSIKPPHYDQTKLPGYEGMSVKPPDYEGLAIKSSPHYEEMSIKAPAGADMSEIKPPDYEEVAIKPQGLTTKPPLPERISSLPKGDVLVPKGGLSSSNKSVSFREERGLLQENSRGLLEENPRRLLGENPRRLLEENPRRLPEENPKGLLEENPRGLLEENPRRLLEEDPRRILEEDEDQMDGKKSDVILVHVIRKKLGRVKSSPSLTPGDSSSGSSSVCGSDSGSERDIDQPLGESLGGRSINKEITNLLPKIRPKEPSGAVGRLSSNKFATNVIINNIKNKSEHHSYLRATLEEKVRLNRKLRNKTQEGEEAPLNPSVEGIVSWSNHGSNNGVTHNDRDNSEGIEARSHLKADEKTSDLSQEGKCGGCRAENNKSSQNPPTQAPTEEIRGQSEGGKREREDRGKDEEAAEGKEGADESNDEGKGPTFTVDVAPGSSAQFTSSNPTSSSSSSTTPSTSSHTSAHFERKNITNKETWAPGLGSCDGKAQGAGTPGNSSKINPLDPLSFSPLISSGTPKIRHEPQDGASTESTESTESKDPSEIQCGGIPNCDNQASLEHVKGDGVEDSNNNVHNSASKRDNCEEVPSEPCPLPTRPSPAEVQFIASELIDQLLTQVEEKIEGSERSKESLTIDSNGRRMERGKNRLQDPSPVASVKVPVQAVNKYVRSDACDDFDADVNIWRNSAVRESFRGFCQELLESSSNTSSQDGVDGSQSSLGSHERILIHVPQPLSEPQSLLPSQGINEGVIEFEDDEEDVEDDNNGCGSPLSSLSLNGRPETPSQRNNSIEYISVLDNVQVNGAVHRSQSDLDVSGLTVNDPPEERLPLKWIISLDLGSRSSGFSYWYHGDPNVVHIGSWSGDNCFHKIPSWIFTSIDNNNLTQNESQGENNNENKKPLGLTPLATIKVGQEALDSYMENRGQPTAGTFVCQWREFLQLDADTARLLPFPYTLDTAHDEMDFAQLVTALVNFFGRAALGQIRAKYSNAFTKDEHLEWLITIPTNWNARSRQCIREAAYKSGAVKGTDGVNLIEDPLAAALFASMCGPHDNFLAVDVGGAFMHYTGFAKTYGALKQVVEARSLSFPTPESSFETLLTQLVSPEFLLYYKAKYRPGWMEVLRNFEKAKCKFDTMVTSQSSAFVYLPYSFVHEFHCYTGTEVSACLKEKNLGITWNNNGALCICESEMKLLLRPTLDFVVNRLEHVLKKQEFRNLVLTGGLAKSKFLKEIIASKFPGVNLVMPKEFPNGVLQGATLSLMPNIQPKLQIKSPFSVGVGVMTPFDADAHPAEKKIVKDGKAWCADVWDTLIKHGQDMEINSVVNKRSYVGAQPGQSCLVLPLFKSTSSQLPKLVTDKSVGKCCELRFESTKTWQEIDLLLTCRASELVVTAVDRDSVVHRVVIDFI